MGDYDDLRRGRYHVDAARRAARQEADELGRSAFRPDALSKAAEQEAVEHRRATRQARGDQGPARGATPRDRGDHVTTGRATPGSQDRLSGGGGAVVSRRSGLGAALRRRLRQGRDVARDRRGAAARERRRAPAPGRGHGATRAIAAAIAVVVVLYLVICLPIDRAISFSRDEREGLSQELSWHVPGMPYYVLALGSDAREGETVSRSDTMILVRVDPLGGKLTMLSIPRDTMVEIEGHGTSKINAAYAYGGAAGAVRAVRKLTGTPIAHVAVVCFDGVESLVDHLGGVTVDVPVAVYDPVYTGLQLPAGEQRMDGHTALLFSRVRHGFALGDYQRQKDQRILMEAIMREVLGLSPLQMPGVVGHMGGMLGTSMRMYSILPLMLRLKLGGATIYQATVPSTTAMVDGVSYVVADDEALAKMMGVIDAGGDPASLA